MNRVMEIDPQLQCLIDAHPLLFRGRAPAVPSYVTAGWYALVEKLCADIETALGPETCQQFEVRQIKEKFGTLRFYYRIGEREDLHIDFMSSQAGHHVVGRFSNPGTLDAFEVRVRELVGAACKASETICETCGASAELRNLGGWCRFPFKLSLSLFHAVTESLRRSPVSRASEQERTLT